MHGDGLVIVTYRWHTKEVLRSKWNVEVQTLGPGSNDSKKVLNLSQWRRYEKEHSQPRVVQARRVSGHTEQMHEETA